MVDVLLADSHCHLDWFENPGKIVENALSAGVGSILSNSTDFASIGKNLSLSSEFKQVKACLGVHPENVLSMDKSELEQALEFTSKNIQKAAAVGEVGLDFKYAATQEQRKKQEEIFREFISIAKKAKKSVIVHA